MNQSTPIRKQANTTGDVLGAILAVTTAALALIVVGGHVYLATRGEIEAGWTFVLNVLAITFSAVCTVWVGRWSAKQENRPFIRAALRTTHVLMEGIEAAEQAALDGIGRMKNRASDSPEVTSGLWAEILGRMLDHLRGLKRETQATIANWQEYGPEEIARLQDAERNKARALSEITEAAENVKDILHELQAFSGIADTSELRLRVEELRQEREKISTSSALALPGAGEARSLLALGAYEEAANAYTNIIESSSGTGSHTAYIGRARARYLAGDTKGALGDLAAAEKICPADAAIERVRTEIVTGRRPTSMWSPSAFKSYVNHGNAALMRGDGESALRHFAKAQELGLFDALAAQDKAMALLLLKRFEEARKELDAAQDTTEGPFVTVQSCVIRALADTLEEGQPLGYLEELRDALEELRLTGQEFHLSESPIRFLISGLRRKDMLSDGVQAVLRELGTPSP